VVTENIYTEDFDATFREVEYLQRLAKQRNVSFAMPRTAAEAHAEIRRLRSIERVPSRKQLEYIAALAERLGTPRPKPRTVSEGDAAIRELKARLHWDEPNEEAA